LSPNDVLQVINYINDGGPEQESSDGAAEGEPDSDRDHGIASGWLVALESLRRSVPSNSPNRFAEAFPQADERVEWLSAAVDDSAYRTAYLRTDGRGTQRTWLEYPSRRGLGVAELGGLDLPDWETSLDILPVNPSGFDAVFAKLGQSK
jgi:hypothetical protein